jgi:hypothetical protein
MGTPSTTACRGEGGGTITRMESGGDAPSKNHEKVNPPPAVSRMTYRVTDAPSRISARQHSYLDQRKSMSTAFS